MELGAAAWVFANNHPAGAGTDSLPGARALYLPLAASRGPVGVLGVAARDPGRFADPEQMHFLEAFANQLAVAVERARLADEAARARQAGEMDRVRSEFVAVASEELRAPLEQLEASLARASRSMHDGGADSRRALACAGEEARRMRALADDLLYLSRLQAGREQMHVGAVRPGAIIARASDGVRSEVAGRGIDLETEAGEDIEAMIDPAAAERVLRELLRAGIGLAPPGGSVLVSADPVDGFVQFSVATGGAEIPPDAQGRVFDAFSRVPGSPRADGTGLGLAIAREIVRAHGGEIWVDSGPGPGAVFSFTVPSVQREGT